MFKDSGEPRHYNEPAVCTMETRGATSSGADYWINIYSTMAACSSNIREIYKRGTSKFYRGITAKRREFILCQ